MSHRQTERPSRFASELETLVLAAGGRFRDDDPDQSVRTAIRLWSGSHMRGRRFVQLVQEASSRTSERVSLGSVERGTPGRREAMPYFFAILRDLVAQERAR
jgi:hypothetical protein